MQYAWSYFLQFIANQHVDSVSTKLCHHCSRETAGINNEAAVLFPNPHTHLYVRFMIMIMIIVS